MILFLSPSRLSCLCRDLGSFPLAQGCGTGMASLEAAQAPQRDRSGIFGALGGGLKLWNLAGGFEHDLIGKLVRITRAGLLL